MDPYKILDVTPDSTDAEVEAAYYSIVDRYKKDSLSDNPLAYLAEEKINEANDAYNEIKLKRANKNKPSQFIDVRRLVNNNMVNEANEILDGVPFENRDAEWYFLKGTVQFSRGWLEDAYENFVRASELNPENTEYRAAMNQLAWQRRTGQPYGGYNQTGGVIGMQCGACEICASMFCAGMCCKGMTGC